MRLLSLRLHRFGSFIEPTTFHFPDGPGLYFMQGRNEAEPRLEANGTGKTTIWRALTWCMFGKDARGLKAGDVANWEEPKGAYVALDFISSSGEKLRVQRTHSPNSWTLSSLDPLGYQLADDLTKDETNRLYAMLQLEFEPWLNCVLMAQGEPMFLDLKADAKAQLFSEVMGLDRWLDYAGNASKLSNVEASRLIELGRTIAEIEGELRGLGTESLLAPSAAWESGRKKRLAAVTEAYEQSISRIDGLKAQLTKAEQDLGFARETLADHVCIRAKDAELVAEKKAITKRCGECGALLRHEEFAKDAERLAERDKIIRQDQDAVRQAEYKLSQTRSEYDRNEKQLDQLEDEADDVKAESNPYAAMADAAARNRERLEAQLDEVQRRHRDAAERATMLGFWIRGFKDLRLGLISEALEELAIEVNSCVTALGLIGWELVFEVDRETKAGGITRGFSVYVRSPHNDQSVPWASWSGGEAQRLRLATQLGLSNLIRSTTGASIALEVWDEPTSGMSARGIGDLLEALKARAHDEQRQIWIVDHRSLGYAGFDGEVTIVKDAQGSRVET